MTTDGWLVLFQSIFVLVTGAVPHVLGGGKTRTQATEPGEACVAAGARENPPLIWRR